jgi:flagellar M-ring protein FliF
MVKTSALRDIWRNLGPKGQLGLAASALLVIVTMFFLYRTAAKPSYTALLTGLDPAQSSQIGDALTSGGVSWRLANGGTEVDVVKGQESNARVALAKKGLPNGGHVGFELFDKQSFGATDFQQQVDYQRALEGEIARTIESIEGVTHADVQLALPRDSVFSSEAQNATAAVLVTGGSSLDGATVRGIAHLVASSVKSLSPNDVTITDEQGNLLWPTGDGVGTPGDLTKMAAEQRYDAELSAEINALLTQTLGEGKAQARVHSDLNLDQATISKVTFAKTGTPVTSQLEQEGLKSKGAGSAAPANANLPAAATNGGNSNYTRKSATTQYGVNKTVEQRVVAPGSVTRLDVALLVDSSVPAKQVAGLKQSVAALAGIDPKRGDTLAVSTLAFAKQPAPAAAAKSGPLPPGAAGLIKWVALLGGVLGLGFLVRRNLKRREREPIALEPTWLREIEQAVPIAELNGASRNGADLQADALRVHVEQIARQQPEQVAIQVGQWMKD